MARSFNGTTDFIDCGQGVDPAIADAFTLSAWAKFESVAGAPRIISRFNGTTDERYVLHLNAGVITLYLLSSAGLGQFASGTTAIGINRWYHFMGSFIPSTSIAVYVGGTQDGILNAGVTADLITHQPVRPLIIGADSDGGGHSNKLTGLIAEVTIWNTGLGPAEAATLASGVNPMTVGTANLVGYWPLCGIGSPEPDHVAGFDGAVTGAAFSVDHPYPSVCGDGVTTRGAGMRRQAGW